MSEPACSDSKVIKSVERVAARSRWVRLNPEMIEPAVDRWGKYLEVAPAWSHPCHFFDGGDRSVQWIFVLDVLNHCFWPAPNEPRWAVSYRGEEYSGYWALAAALKRAVERGIPVTDAGYLEAVDEQTLGEILAGYGTIPLLEKRVENLREAGRVLQRHWQGKICNLFEAAQWDALLIAERIVGDFPSFRDQTLHEGEPVYFWKRAQLFVADVYQAFSGRFLGAFRRIECLSAFADYKLPQVLRELGILHYRPQLAEWVDSRRLLPAGCRREVEIRAMTLVAVERLKAAFEARGRCTTSQQIDNWLWQLGQWDRFRKRPYHLCRTIYY